MADKPSLSKFVMSFFQWIPWLKTTRHLVGILIILVVVGGIYVKFFKKGNVQATTFQGDVKEVNIINKASRVFIPFVEGSIGQESGNDGLDTSIRTGLRFEF